MSLVSNPKYQVNTAGRNFNKAVSEGTSFRLAGTGSFDPKKLHALIPELDGISFADIRNAAKYNPDLIDKLMEKYSYANAGALIRPRFDPESDISGTEMQEIDAAIAKNYDANTTPNSNYTEEEYNSLNMPAGQELIPFSVDHPMHPKNTYVTLANAKKGNKKDYRKILDSVLEAYGGFPPYRDALIYYINSPEGAKFSKEYNSKTEKSGKYPTSKKKLPDPNPNIPPSFAESGQSGQSDQSGQVEGAGGPFTLQEQEEPSETRQAFSLPPRRPDNLKESTSAPVSTNEQGYKTYKKDSAEAQSFRDAFSAAEDGDVFEWDGREYRKDYA